MESWRSYLLKEEKRQKIDYNKIINPKTNRPAQSYLDLASLCLKSTDDLEPLDGILDLTDIGSDKIDPCQKYWLDKGNTPCTSSADCDAACQKKYNSAEYKWSKRQGKCVNADDQKREQHIVKWKDLGREIKYMERQFARHRDERDWSAVGNPNQIRYNEYRWLHMMSDTMLPMVGDIKSAGVTERQEQALEFMHAILGQFQESEAYDVTLTDGTADGFMEFFNKAIAIKKSMSY
jgi:hypothetical protein